MTDYKKLSYILKRKFLVFGRRELIIELSQNIKLERLELISDPYNLF